MKLHIGGEEKKEGWKIFNIQKSDNVDYVGDIRDLSQFDENIVDEIYASHVIEHIPLKDVEETFKGIYRILRENGKFYISVPDMDILFRMFLHSEAPLKAKYDIMRVIFGGQQDDFDYHYFGWNFEFLKNYLRASGFRKADRVKSFSMFNDTSDFAIYGQTISLNLIAYK